LRKKQSAGYKQHPVVAAVPAACVSRDRKIKAELTRNAEWCLAMWLKTNEFT